MNNFEKSIREKMQEREIQPSVSAWERLHYQLDVQGQKKKKSWFLYIGYAASILLIISLFIFINENPNNEIVIPENTIVEDDFKFPGTTKVKRDESLLTETNRIVKNKGEEFVIDKKNTQNFKGVSLNSKVAVKNDIQDLKEKKSFITPSMKNEIAIIKEIPNTDKIINGKEKLKTERRNSPISVDSNALLYAVTHNKQEVKRYYEKYKISKSDVLYTIEKELRKTNLKIDPNTILAEVEREVSEEFFQNNFYTFIKKRVSDVAVAIANRNN